MISAKQFFYVMVSVLIICFVGIIGVFYWGDSQLKSKASVIANLKSEKDIASEKIIALNRAKQSTEKSDEATRILDSLLPSTKKQETLVADVIYTASAEAGIPVSNITSITFSNSGEPTDTSGTNPFKEVPGVLSYPFNMSVQNISYTTLLKLLQEIETNGRLVQIDDMQISPDKTAAGEISSVTLSLKAFLKP